MGAYKQFLASDIIVAPLEVHKDFSFKIATSQSTVIIYPGGVVTDVDIYSQYFTDGTYSTSPGVGIDRLLGRNITGSLFNPYLNSDPRTGMFNINVGLTVAFTGSQWQRLVYNSIKELYYSNYLSSSYSDLINRPQLVPGRDEEGNVYVGKVQTPAYDNYLQTTLTYPRYFPTGSDQYIGVISIPSLLFGDYVEPNSFLLETVSGSFTDDGEGNIISGSEIVGNIIYPHGMIILTGNERIYSSASNAGTPAGLAYGTAVYATNVYGAGSSPNAASNQWVKSLFAAITSTNVTCSFSSSYTIYETQYKCTIRENEYNFTLNPSTISGSFNTGSTAGSVYGYVTESYFSPYITTIGLYDEQQNLLAVAKLSQPLPSSPTTDMNIIINIDR